MSIRRILFAVPPSQATGDVPDFQERAAAAYATFLGSVTSAAQYGEDQVHRPVVADPAAAEPPARMTPDHKLAGTTERQAPPAPPVKAQQGERSAPLSEFVDAIIVQDIDQFSIHTWRAVYAQDATGCWLERTALLVGQKVCHWTNAVTDRAAIDALNTLAAAHGQLIQPEAERTPA